jgi:hypothetical protein
MLSTVRNGHTDQALHKTNVSYRKDPAVLDFCLHEYELHVEVGKSRFADEDGQYTIIATVRLSGVASRE